MDIKRLAIAVCLAMALTLGWEAFRTYMCRSHNWNCDVDQTPPPTASNSPAGAPHAGPSGPGSQPASQQATGPALSAAPAILQVLPTTAPSPSPTLGVANPHDPAYALAVHLDADGAGIQGVTLNDYQDAQETHGPYVYQEPFGDTPLATGVVNVNAITAPYWLKLTRAGNVFTAYYSPDGAKWTQVGPAQTIVMNASAYVGLADTSHDNGTLSVSTVDNVNIGNPVLGPPPLAPALTTKDIGAPGQAGSSTFASGVFTLQGGGYDIQGATDQFQYAYQPITGDASIVARVTSVGATDTWAKTGLMIRDSLDANSANVLVALTPGNGVTCQWRPTAGGDTDSTSVNGSAIDLAGVAWHRQGDSTATRATYAVDLGEKTPILRVLKTYEVFPRTGGLSGSNGYEMDVTFAFENLTPTDIKVAMAFNGPSLPPRELDSSGERQVIAGFRSPAGSVESQSHFIEKLLKDKSTEDVSSHEKPGYNFLWAGTVSAYFAAIVRPEDTQHYNYIVTARALDPQQTDLNLQQAVVTFNTTATVPASGKLNLPFTVFLGPKDRELLNSPYYSGPALGYDTLLTSSGFCGTWCTFSWLITTLVYMLRGFHFVLRDWGLAIIALVVLVRLCLHPITKRSQVSMMKMTKLGPEIERLKKKHGDNKEELNKAMMGVYKEQGLTPILGCLPMFLQMPIWFALYSVLRTTIELRQAPFLWGLTWIHNLAKPDRLIRFHHPVELFGLTAIAGINFLPVLLMVAFFLQQKFQPKPVAATPEQAQQQKMMQWMSLLFPVMLYTYPSGLNIYIFTSTGIGVWESKIIRDHIKQREEAEKAGRVLVEAKATRSGRRLAKDDQDADAKPGCLTGWFAELQKRAEDMRKRK